MVAELIAQGEPVTYCLPCEDEALVRPTGARFRAIANVLPELRRRPAPPLSELATASVLGAIRVLPELLEVVAAERPSYIVYDAFCLAGRLLAQLSGLPAVKTNATYAFDEQALASGAFGRLSDPEVVQRALAGYEEAMGRLVRRFGIDPLSLWDLLIHAEPLNIVFCRGPSSRPATASTTDGCSWASRCRGTPLRRSLFGPLDGGPGAYVSLGTIYNDRPEFFRACLEAFAGSEWRVVVATGDRLDPAGLQAVPDNVVLRPWVSQEEVLARSQVFVTHGGMNSIMEAEAQAVPLVVVPQQSEQAVTARRVEELGIGRRLDAATSPRRPCWRRCVRWQVIGRSPPGLPPCGNPPSGRAGRGGLRRNYCASLPVLRSDRHRPEPSRKQGQIRRVSRSRATLLIGGDHRHPREVLSLAAPFRKSRAIESSPRPRFRPTAAGKELLRICQRHPSRNRELPN